MSFEKITTEELKQRLTSQGVHGIALDIDDVLSHTDSHWIEKMKEKFGNPNGLTTEKIRDQYHGRFENIPSWSTKEALTAIDEFLHSNEFQEEIPLIEKANHAVEKINTVIPIVAYITARPVSVYEGTRRWLEQHAFPDAPLIFRPLDVHHETKNLWKAELLQFLYPEVVGIVDDHPALPGQLEAAGYQGKLYLYDSGQHTKGYKGMARCRNWDEVVEQVTRDWETTQASR